MKKIINLLKLSLLVLLASTMALYSISLSDWTIKCLKNFPENFGEASYDEKHNTLTAEEFESTITQFIEKFKNDSDFKNKKFWVNKTEPPAWIFDPNDPQWPGDPSQTDERHEITYPYVQKITIKTGDKICFTGDLHGSVHSLIRNLWRLLLLGYIDDNLKLTKNFYLVFTGDYTDRGIAPVETLYTLAELKMANWNNVFLCRGNHDSIAHVINYGFANNLYKRSTIEPFNFKMLQSFSTLLPHALFIKTEDSCILCAHGGADNNFNPNKLFDLKNSTTFEHLEFKNAPHHYIRDYGYGKNLFMWQNYDNKNVIDSTMDYLSKNSIAAIFRGHEHHADAPGFFMIDTKKYIRSHWSPDVVEKSKIDVNGEFSISDSAWFPIFTLISAPGNHTTYDCFAILSANKQAWKLKPYEFALDNYMGGLAYARISEDHAPKLVKTEYAKVSPFADPVSEELLVNAKASTLKLKLNDLRMSLTGLKSKLELLNSKLAKLWTGLVDSA